VRPTDLTDGMGLTFVDKVERCVNGMAVILNGSLTTGLTLLRHPSLKLVSKGCWMRPQNNTNAQLNFGADALGHGEGVRIRLSMPIIRFWWC